MPAIGRVKTSIPFERPEPPITALFGRIGNAFVTGIIIIWVVGLEIIVDIAPYMRRIMTAAVVIGIIIVDIGRPYRQVNPYAAAATVDLNYIVPGAFAGVQQGLPGRRRIGHRGKAP
jgi:hypothetical protein